MKVKEITGKLLETDVQLKPLPGAQAVSVDGRAVGTATTPQAATAISDLAKKGEFTPTDPTQTNQLTPEEVPGNEPANGEAGLVQHYATQLKALLPQATQPWEKAQIEARIQAATKDGWIPKNPDGSPIAVLPPKEWEAKMDPQTVLRINGVNGPGLSPEFKQKMGGTISQGIMKYTGFEEAQKDPDTVDNGNTDIGGPEGGDKTDDFINDITDQAFTRAQRGGTKSPLGSEDPLSEMLRIAGLR